MHSLWQLQYSNDSKLQIQVLRDTGILNHCDFGKYKEHWADF